MEPFLGPFLFQVLKTAKHNAVKDKVASLLKSDYEEWPSVGVLETFLVARLWTLLRDLRSLFYQGHWLSSGLSSWNSSQMIPRSGVISKTNQ